MGQCCTKDRSDAHDEKDVPHNNAPDAVPRNLPAVDADSSTESESEVSDDTPFEYEERLYDGKAADLSRVRTVLVMGETGSGKSTLLNAMANWCAGVGYHDRVRYRLVRESPQDANQAFSQTQSVHKYLVECPQLSYTLRLIDTPGFGDTGGLQRDEQITQQIQQALGEESEIHGVCFVAAAAAPRLTMTQQYIINKVLTMLGSDATDNVYLLATFADGKKAQVLSAIKQSGFPYSDERTFHFNNSALYASGDERNEYTRGFWDMGTASLARFFEQLATKAPFSLSQTKDVIETQKELQNYVASITPQVTVGLSKIDALRRVLDDIRVNRNKINETSSYTYTQTIPKVERKQKPKGLCNTQCLRCSYNCHHDCARLDKRLCYTMDKNGNCTVCPQKCHYSHHANLDYYFVWSTETVTQEYDTKRLLLVCAEKGLTLAEALRDEVLGELRGVYDNVAVLMSSIHAAHRKLDAIALRPTNLEFNDYVKLLIEQEKLERRPGFEGRITQLQSMMLAQGAASADPIGQWRQKVEGELEALSRVR